MMTTTNLDRVFEEVKALTPEEQMQLRDMLYALLAKNQAQTAEEEFERRLLERGVISRIPPPITDLTPYRDRKLLEVEGKPLSETIIEERR